MKALTLRGVWYLGFGTMDRINLKIRTNNLQGQEHSHGFDDIVLMAQTLMALMMLFSKSFISAVTLSVQFFSLKTWPGEIIFL